MHLGQFWKPTPQPHKETYLDQFQTLPPFGALQLPPIPKTNLRTYMPEPHTGTHDEASCTTSFEGEGEERDRGEAGTEDEEGTDDEDRAYAQEHGELEQ